MLNQKMLLGTTRALAVIGYLVCMLQWLWFTTLVLSILADNGVLDSFISPAKNPSESSGVELPPAFALAIGGVVTLVMIIISLIVLIRLPGSVAKTGEIVTHKTTKFIMPVVLQHKKVSKKKRRELTARVTFYIRFILIGLPFILLFTLPTTKLSYELTIFMGGFLAILAITLLAAESLLTKLVTKK